MLNCPTTNPFLQSLQKLMVGSTRSETLKVQEQEREMAEDMVGKTDSHSSLLLITCQDLFARIAEATGETLESVYLMQEAERNGLVDVLNLKQVGFSSSLNIISSRLIISVFRKSRKSQLWNQLKVKTNEEEIAPERFVFHVRLSC